MASIVPVILSGGSGADDFEFDRGDGTDRIVDFQNGIDRIELDDFTRAEVRAALSAARMVDGDLVLRLSNTTIITFDDVSRAQLDIGDFVF